MKWFIIMRVSQDGLWDLLDEVQRKYFPQTILNEFILKDPEKLNRRIKRDVDRLILLFSFSGGQFDWGGRLLKGNGGAQRFPQAGWKSADECKGRRELDCETYKSNRDESRP